MEISEPHSFLGGWLRIFIHRHGLWEIGIFGKKNSADATGALQFLRIIYED